MPTKFPHTAKTWAEFLNPQRLAVSPADKAVLVKQLEDESLNPILLAEELKREPALCLLLFSEANKRTRASVQSLKHALNLLGTSRITRMMADAPDRDALKLSDEVWDGYRQCLSGALFAAELSRLLNSQGDALSWISQLSSQDIAKLMSTEAEALYWATLLRGAPMWALWLQASPLMLEWHASMKHGEPPAGLEKRLFGCRLRDICAATAEAWHLPEMTIESWQPTPSLLQLLPKLGRMARKGGHLPPQQQTPTLAAIISHGLATAIEHNWHSHETMRLQAVVGGWLGVSPDEGSAIVHKWAAECSREHPMEDCLPPAMTLLLTAPQTSAPPVSKPAPRSHAAPTSTGAPNMAACQRLLQRLVGCDFNALPELLTCCADELPQALGVEGVTITMLNRDRTQLRTYFVGGKVPPALAGFQHVLAQGDIFSRLSERPSGAFVPEARRAQYLKLLPDHFRTAMGQREFMLMSVFVRGKPVALICGASAQPIAEESYTLFKRVCTQLGASLQQLTDRSRAG